MGKTTLMVKLMLYYWVNMFDNITIFCPTYSKDSAWRPVDTYYGKKVVVYSKVSDVKIRNVWAKADRRRAADPKHVEMIYFDDCTGQEDFKVNDERGIINQLVSKGNHSGISTVYVVQKFTQCSTTMRLNAEGLITFFTQSENEKKYIWGEVGVGTYKKFKEVMDSCTREPYHSFFVNRQGPGMPDYFHNFKWIKNMPV